MTQLSKEEFLQWRTEFATKEFFNSIIHRIEDAKDILVAQAGKDSYSDAFIAGMVHAFREVLSVEWED